MKTKLVSRDLTPSERKTPRVFFNVANLDEERERGLLARTRSANPADDGQAALTELWMSHAKLVAAIAARHQRPGLDTNDLINAGHLGLHTAITRFDASRFDGRLAAYAAIWIRCHILDYIRRNSGPVRMPESKGHRLLARSATRLALDARAACAREDVAPTDAELHERIGRRIGLSGDEVAKGLRLIQNGRASLSVAGEDGEGGNDFRDETALTADDMIRRLDHDRLRTRLRVLANEILGERERLVFLARGMADSDQVPSLEDFAARFGVTAARVSQIEASARRKLSTALAASGYGDFDGDEGAMGLSRVRSRRRGGNGRAGARTPLQTHAAMENAALGLQAAD